MIGARYHFTTPHPGLPVPESLADPGQRSLPWHHCTHDPSHLKCVGPIDLRNEGSVRATRTPARSDQHRQ